MCRWRDSRTISQTRSEERLGRAAAILSVMVKIDVFRDVKVRWISKLGSTHSSLSVSAGKCVGSLSCRILVSAQRLRLSLLIGGRSGGPLWLESHMLQTGSLDGSPLSHVSAAAAAFDEATRQTGG